MTKCRICESTDHKNKFKKYGYEIVECLDCSLVYTNFSPDKNFFEKYYQKDYFVKGNNKRSYDDYSS